MANGVVFKQWYKSMNLSNTPMLNGKHLIYIATRPGAIRNKDCGFGLFGRLPFMGDAEDINNIKKAHTMITSVSRRRTIYRAILSVDDETGKNKGLYDRDNWQELVNRKIDVIANEMNIDRKDFCWVASMHYEKGHPHVHVMYWDNGSKVRNEFVPKDWFEEKAERIRGEFGREIYKEEIYERGNIKRNIEHEARLELQSLCKEQNLMEVLSVKKISQAKLSEIGQKLYDLCLSCPGQGSMKYKYMPEAFKVQLNSIIAEIMKISDFHKLEESYLKLTDEISEYYGNGEEEAETYRNKEMEKLYTGLGNEILQYIKSNQLQSSPTEIDDLKLLIHDDIKGLMENSKSFVELSRMYPKYRTPPREILTNDFKQKKDEVVNEILSDIRVKTKIQAYIKNIKYVQEVKVSPEAKLAENKVLSRETYAPLFRAVDDEIMDALYEKAGYDQQMKTDMAVNMLIQIFGSSSQGLNQLRSQHQLNKSRSKDISKTALGDLRKRMEQQGSWEPEL
jgi:hypothetical protein